MKNNRMHINWYMLLNMLFGYAISILMYGAFFFSGIDIQDVFYQNIIQIIYMITIVVVPSILYFRITYPFQKFKRGYLKPIKLKRVPLYCFLAVCLWCVGIFVNGLFVLFLERYGILPLQQLSPSNDILTIALGFISVCIVAPVFEEFFFRGIILSGYTKYGVFTAIAASSFLFALAHGSITVFFLPLIYGSVCSWIVRKTKSIYPGMIMHAVCNFISWFIFIMKIDGKAEIIINSFVMIIGMLLTIAIIIYGVKYISNHKESVLLNIKLYFKSIAREYTWIAIVIIYIINNTLVHMKIN